jgi:hypothetical protein
VRPGAQRKLERSISPASRSRSERSNRAILWSVATEPFRVNRVWRRMISPAALSGTISQSASTTPVPVLVMSNRLMWSVSRLRLIDKPRVGPAHREPCDQQIGRSKREATRPAPGAASLEDIPVADQQIRRIEVGRQPHSSDLDDRRAGRVRRVGRGCGARGSCGQRVERQWRVGGAGGEGYCYQHPSRWRDCPPSGGGAHGGAHFIAAVL